MPEITIDLPDDVTDEQGARIAEILADAVKRLQTEGLTHERIVQALMLFAGQLQTLPFDDDPIERIRMAAIDSVNAALFDPAGKPAAEDSAEDAMLEAIGDAPEFKALLRYLKRLDAMDPEEKDLAALAQLVPQGLKLLNDAAGAIRAYAEENEIPVAEDVESWRKTATDDDLDAESEVLFLDELDALGCRPLAGAINRWILTAVVLRKEEELDLVERAFEGLDLPASWDFTDSIAEARDGIACYEQTREVLFSGSPSNPLGLRAYYESAAVDQVIAEAWLEQAIEAGEIQKVKKGNRWILQRR